MLKKYIKDIVKTELMKQKLNDIYGLARSYNLNSVSDKERQELNEEILILKNLNNNVIDRNKYLKLEISNLILENEKLEESIKNLGGTVSLKDNLLNEKNKEIEELKDLYEQERNKNYKTLESVELKQEIEKLKKENEQLKNLSCTIVVGNDGKLDSLFNQKLKSENEKLKKELLDSKNGLNGANDIIKNTKQENQKLKGDKEVLEEALEESNNYVAYLEKETKKLNEKLDGIKYVIKKQRLSALTYEKLKDTFMLIERYIKES